ncbi:AMP-dependent synthetase [Deinococcus irradiatisoli]|uniref:AMP-dependent synthetase n=1 Tax=Deinococcus irradiatisoli TaxID=2202254 RepID=A0A2Z3JAU1_9DEIO|nr:fatty acyl-AMP ligase [Deinococcus irradiatisoli]AWN22233.1 AMP-dependent synthetase [Deinococcus irradiatisoli]
MDKEQVSNPPHWPTLLDLLRDRATMVPNQGLIYLADGEAQEIQLSYQTLHGQAQLLAAQLQQRFKPGDRAILIFGEGLEIIPAFFGVIYAGLVAVPLMPPRPGQPADDLLALMADAQASLILTTTDVSHFLQSVLGASNGSLPIIATDAPVPGDLPLWTRPDLSAESLAALLYTSGSTSLPRGVMMTHRHIMRRLGGLADLMASVDTSGATVNWLPLQHLMGLFGSVLQPMYMDIQAVVLPTSKVIERPVRWLQAMSRFRAGSSGAPNFAFQMCVDRVNPQERQDLDLSHWKLAILSTEAIRTETLDQFAQTYTPFGFRRSAYYTAYGLSESAGTFDIQQRPIRPSTLSLDPEALEKDQVRVHTSGAGLILVGCGMPMPGQEIVIVDPETLQPCENDRVGEIWIRGPQVADGYWHQPEATAQTFQAFLSTGEGPYLRSGDLGFFYDQELYIAGRLKEMLIVRGKNLYAVDLERTAEAAHPALLPASSAAFSIPVDGEEQLVLIHEVRPDQTEVDVEDVASAVRRLIGERHLLPVHSVVLVEAGSIPRTDTGKIRRAYARSLFLKQSGTA